MWLLAIDSHGSASWQQLAVAGAGPAPVARDKHVLACVGGRVVLFGGFGMVEEEEEEEEDSSDASSESGSSSGESDGPAATFKWFDDLWELHVDVSASSCSWRCAAASDGPSCRAAPASAVHNDTLFIFGGRLANGGPTPRDNALWCLTHQDSESKWLWRLMHAGDRDASCSICPPGRSAAAAACLQDGALVVACGTGNDSKALGDVWIYSRGSWNSISSSSIAVPPARSAACCAALPPSSLLLAFGSSGLDVASGISATYVLHFAPQMRIAATARHRLLLQVPWRLVAGLRQSEAVVWTAEQVYQVADFCLWLCQPNIPLQTPALDVVQ